MASDALSEPLKHSDDLRSHLDNLPCTHISLAPEAIHRHHNGAVEQNHLAILLRTGRGGHLSVTISTLEGISLLWQLQ
jgi:hypothetical protein